MQLHVASATDRGKVREINEDALLASPPLFAVADGMGGHEGGEVASRLALDTLTQWKQRLEGHHGNDAAQRLRSAFAEANRVVWEKGRSDEALAGMGTTLTAGWIDGNVVALAHVGDSRAYLVRNGKLQQLTEDQTVAQEWVRRGRLTEDEAAASPHRHLLLQAIGAEPSELKIDVATVELRPGDRFVLASDGLYGMVKDPERIRAILVENNDPDAACRALVDAANAAGGEDNISVLIVDHPGGDAASDEAVVIERPGAGRKRPLAGRGPRRALIGAVAVIAVALGGVFALMRSGGPTYVVSARGGTVVVLDGRVGHDDVPATGKVVRVFEDQPIDRFPSSVRDDLRTGIAVDSLGEADRLVRITLFRRLGPQDTPTPSPLVPSPSGILPSGSPAP
jgi:serine/threonine protein phosphatase PrpC